MLSTRNAGLLSSVAGLMVAVCVSVAQADDHKGSGRIETEIDKLRGELRYDGNEWNLAIEYKIEFEGGLPAGEPVLVLTVTESGRLLADDEGRPIEVVVPLDQPSDVDDDEIEFKQELNLFLPPESIREPTRVALHGAVYVSGIERPLAAANKSVRFDYPRVQQTVTHHQTVVYHRVSTGYSRTIVHHPVSIGHSRTVAHGQVSIGYGRTSSHSSPSIGHSRTSSHHSPSIGHSRTSSHHSPSIGGHSSSGHRRILIGRSSSSQRGRLSSRIHHR